MAYLAVEGFKHRSLTCSNILLNTDGDVKIGEEPSQCGWHMSSSHLTANQECCHVISEPKGTPHDFGALSSITMELMQKYVKEDGAIGIDNLQRWPSNSDAVGFLSATTSAASAAELLQVCYFSLPLRRSRKALPSTIAASAPEPSMAKGVAHRHHILGPGLYARALQVHTTMRRIWE
jgi:hypothetical protein